MKKKWVVLGMILVALGGVALIPIGGDMKEATVRDRATPMDFSTLSDAAPKMPLRLLFIHHSCGGQLLASTGDPKEEANCIYLSHPNGGGLRDLLNKQGYEVHEASYGSEIGENTDLFDWLPKFRDRMGKVLTVELNDKYYNDGRQNQIIVFKSCYPNNLFVDVGKDPGNPVGPELTVTNAKATLRMLLPEMQKHPETLFVYLTTPPIAPKGYTERLGKLVLKKILGRPSVAEVVSAQGRLARLFANWVVSPVGWLKDYPLKNVVVFDYYDVLTNHGASDLSCYPTESGIDSHPSRIGNEKVAAEFVTFLNRAVHRMGLSE